MTSVALLSRVPEWEWPPDAAALLLEALRGGAANESELELAAELAGSVVVMNDEIARTLLELLLDPNTPASIRGAAAIALGPTLEAMDTYDPEDPVDALEEPLVSGTVHRAMRQALHRTYLDADAPKEVRRRALEASVRSLETWHPGAIRAAYGSGDEDWKLTAVFGMRYVPDFQGEILETLESSHGPIRLEAIRAAGEREVQAAWPRIRTILEARTGEKALLIAAIEAAGRIRPDEAARLFAGLDDSDEEIAAAMDEALALGGGFEDFSEDDEA